MRAGAWISSLVRNYDSFNMVLTSLPGKEKEALQQILDKVEYVHRFGFTDEVLQPLIEKLPARGEVEYGGRKEYAE